MPGVDVEAGHGSGPHDRRAVRGHRPQPAPKGGFRGFACPREQIAHDINRAIPGATVFEDAEADYRFRAVVPRRMVADAMRTAILGIDYPNFKDSVQEHDRHAAYSRVWGDMTALQPEGGRYHSPADIGDGSASR